MVKYVSTESNECRGCDGRLDCEVCGILAKGSTFSNKDKTKTYDIRKGTLHCNSSMCIYLMTCNICKKQYVGKSEPRFRLRYNNYKTKFRAYYDAWRNGTLNEIDPPIPQAHLYKHFAEHIGDRFRDENGNEDFSFWSFQIIDKSPNKEKLVERENFWVYKLRTMKEEGGLNMQEVPVTGKTRVTGTRDNNISQAGRGRGGLRRKRGSGTKGRGSK